MKTLTAHRNGSSAVTATGRSGGLPLQNLFGSNVFNDRTMRQRLAKSTYQGLRKTIEEGAPLTLEVANGVAEAMKKWALEKGSTHYTHWFQPLTGKTAEKHDSFLAP